MSRSFLFVLSLIVPLLSFAEIRTDLGVVLSEEQIEVFDITIFPDGSNLPEGQGTPNEGRVIYNQQCQMCHGQGGLEGPAARLVGNDGWFEWSDPLRILRINKYPILLISVGGMWPNATSLFDYIRRAMPHYAPKSLNDNQVYALTAYLLHLNGLLEEDLILDKKSMLQIEMPGKQRSVFIND